MGNDPSKPAIRPDPQLLFRYSLVSLVLNHEHRGLVRPEAIAEVAAQRHIDLEGKERTVSVRTLYRLLSSFAQGGPDALIPATRKGGPVVLSPDLLTFFRDQKQATFLEEPHGHGLLGAGTRIGWKSGVHTHTRSLGQVLHTQLDEGLQVGAQPVVRGGSSRGEG